MKPRLVLTGRIFYDKGRYRNGIKFDSETGFIWFVINDLRYEMRVQDRTTPERKELS